MKDDLKGVKKDDGEDAIVDTTPVSEEKAPEELPQAEAESAKEEPKEEGTTEEAPKKGAESRIRELVKERETEKEKSATLASKLEELTRGVTPQEPQAPYQPQAEPGSEVTSEQYRADVMRSADALVQLRIQQQTVIEKINREANESMKAHPELDPDSDLFDKDLSDAVAESALAYVRANPTGSVKAHVEKLMKPYKKSLTKAVGEETETLAKQVSETALRPTNVPSTSKKVEDMSIKELEQKLGTVW